MNKAEVIVAIADMKRTLNGPMPEWERKCLQEDLGGMQERLRQIQGLEDLMAQKAARVQF